MLLDHLRTHTGSPTITVTAPGDDLPGARTALPTTLANLLREAAALIEADEDLDRSQRLALLEQLPDADELAAQVPPRHGVWLAVGPDIGTVLVPLSPGVRATEQVIYDLQVGLVRPLLEHEQRARELLVVTLADDGSDLAVLDVETRELSSVGAPFPISFGGDGSGTQDRAAGSRQRDERRRHHWRRVATAVHEVVVARDLPVVTVGVDRNQGFLREVSAWPQELAVAVLAAPDGLAEPELIARVTAAAEEHRQRRIDDVRRLVAARTDQGRTATGMTDLYDAAVTGRIELLLLVEGPPVTGFLTATGHLVAHDPGDATPVPDVHALGVAQVLSRGGEVLLAPEGTLDAPVATLRW